LKLELISRQPPTLTHSTPLLFVHGAWHGAWCWEEYFLDYFAQHGYATHALSLRGHGGSEGRQRLRWMRLAEYVEDVAQVVGQLPQPPVLIGHSLGGAVVQKYLETHSAPAGILLASVPSAGILATTLRVIAHHPIEYAKLTLTLSLFPLVATPELAHEFLFSKSLPEAQVHAYAQRLQDESYLAFLDILLLNLPRPQQVTTPLLVLGAAQDAIFYPNEVEATARAYHTQAIIFPDLAHDMMLDTGWQKVADQMIGWLGERGL
jgi:pimeloyl-ACP methyl ester carboxylesterase